MAQEQLNALVLPDAQGFFGAHGGKIDHPDLAVALAEIEAGFRSIIGDAAFIAEMKRLLFEVRSGRMENPVVTLPHPV